MHNAFPVLVIAEGFQRQWQQAWLLFGKHGRHSPFGGAVDAGVGPALFPAIQVRMGSFQALEAQPFERSSLGVTDAGLDFAFEIGILHSARHSYCAVMRQHVAIEGIEDGIVKVGNEHALAQVVQHHHADRTAQPAKGLLV